MSTEAPLNGPCVISWIGPFGNGRNCGYHCDMTTILRDGFQLRLFWTMRRQMPFRIELPTITPTIPWVVWRPCVEMLSIRTGTNVV